MAVFPDMVHNNPNLTAGVLSVTAGGIALTVFEKDLMVAGGVALGTFILGRGLIYADSDAETRTITNEYVQIAASRNPKAGTVTFTGSATVDESVAPMVLAAVEEGAAKAKAKKAAKAKAA